MAFDDSGRLTLTMLLGRPAPSRPSGRLVRSRSLKLLVDGAPTPTHLSLCFSAESVHAFVQSVGDTNVLHAGPKPLVPGLAIFEAALQGIAPVRRAELRFRGASFAGETSSCLCSSACKRWKHYPCPALCYTSTKCQGVVDNKMRLSYNKGHVQHREIRNLGNGVILWIRECRLLQSQQGI